MINRGWSKEDGLNWKIVDKEWNKKEDWEKIREEWKK